jgi:hypothetical protein
METAVMIDGAFVRKKFRSAMKKDILALDVQRIVTKIFSVTNISDKITGCISMTANHVQREHLSRYHIQHITLKTVRSTPRA